MFLYPLNPSSLMEFLRYFLAKLLLPLKFLLNGTSNLLQTMLWLGCRPLCLSWWHFGWSRAEGHWSNLKFTEGSQILESQGRAIRGCVICIYRHISPYVRQNLTLEEGVWVFWLIWESCGFWVSSDSLWGGWFWRTRGSPVMEGWGKVGFPPAALSNFDTGFSLQVVGVWRSVKEQLCGWGYIPPGNHLWICSFYSPHHSLSLMGLPCLLDVKVEGWRFQCVYSMSVSGGRSAFQRKWE